MWTWLRESRNTLLQTPLLKPNNNIQSMLHQLIKRHNFFYRQKLSPFLLPNFQPTMSLWYLCKKDCKVSYCKYTSKFFFLPNPLTFYISALYPILSNYLLIYFTLADTGNFLIWTLIILVSGFFIVMKC